MQWKKASEDMKALIESAMQGVDCLKRPMFGYPAYFINDNMFSGLFQDSLFIRLPADLKESLAARYGELAPLEPMPGRPMKDYVVLPEKLYSDRESLRRVIADAARSARALPPKKKKPPKKSRT